MEKNKKLGALMAGAGKTAKELLGNAVQAADQNDDGKFDLADVSAMAGAMGNVVKKSTRAVKDSAGEKARLLELKALRPIFTESTDDAISLVDADFLMPKFIRVADRDKKHAESEVCQGSVGYASDQKGLHVVNIFRDSVNAFGLTFYPDCDSEFYYADPSDRDHYIALDEYFSYLKLVRINELKKLAQDLGAKYFKVTYMEEQISFTAKKASVSLKTPVKADASHEASEQKFSNFTVETEMSFPGHPPVQPQLKYLQRDPTVQALIAMRMDESAPLLGETYMLKMSHSSGMKESDAVKIDTLLKGMKYAGNASVAGEVKNESRRYLKYEIKF